MITNRRILSLPTVSPCVGISPATLLSSLITLSRQIYDFRSKFFATQRRYARQTIRHVGILSDFFEDVREMQPLFSTSVILCFSELHVAFQKIKFLLEDCSREGGRTWMLMKSELVSYEFWLAIRSVSTTLDILPLDAISVCDEVKELVGLVSKQAGRVRFEVDSGDESAMREICQILEFFEKGIEPHSGLIKRVLDYIGIGTWSDCVKEIKFLEDEIRFNKDRDGKELTLLSSVLGFMSYCRGVVFEESDSYRIDTNPRSEILTGLNPEDFRCPISLELMTDPVTVSTGQTYDRSSIQKWFKSGNMICPKTGEKLTTSDLVPNLNLRKLIHQFCADYGISLEGSARKHRDTTILPGSSAAARAVKFLSRFLARRLMFGSIEQKKKVASEIRLLSESNVFNISCLVDAGIIPPLLNLLSSVDAQAQEIATAALLKLSKHKKGRKVIIECGGLTKIVSVLETGHTMESKQTAAAAIYYLSRVKGCQKLIAETTDAVVPALVALVRDGKSRGQKNAVLTILGLLLNRENHQRVLEAGTVMLLVNILATSQKADLITDSLAVLALLSETANGAKAILETPVLPLIVGFVKCSVSREGKEYSVSILLSMCVHGGEDVVATLARDSSLTVSLYSVMNNGVGGSTTASGSKKARSLIKILLEFNDRNYSQGMNCPLPGERIRIHRYNNVL